MPADDNPDWGKFLTVGFEIAIGVGLGAVVGIFIDKKFGSSPWGVLVGILLGCAGGTYLLIKEAVRMNKD